jgi:hypothetical protein
MKTRTVKPIGKNEVIEVVVDPAGKTEAQISTEGLEKAQAEVQKTFQNDMSLLMKNVKLKTIPPTKLD